MTRRAPLLTLPLEQLEDRAVPAQFGIPWTDGTRITMSFVPDGTLVDGAPSVLFQQLGALGAWQQEVVRAVTAWTTATNLNVGIVGDGGQAIGTPGPTQGDARFGDIRIAARALSDNVLALTTPSGHLGGTRAGDIILNSTKHFSIGGANGTYDLFSVLLQETGHSLGIGNSTNEASPMFDEYRGVRTGLIAADVAAVKNLYGTTRAPDALDASGANNSFGSADEIKYTVNADEAALRSLVVRADITTAADIDYYKFKTPKVNNGHGVTVRLTTGGFSSLAPRLYLYSKNQNLIGMVQTVNPLQGELSIFMPDGSYQRDTEYYVRVDSGTAGNQYEIGSYQLKLGFDPDAGDVVTAEATPLLDDAHDNDTVAKADDLHTTPGYAERTHFRALAKLRDDTDKDFYKFKAPKVGRHEALTMTITVRATDPANGLAPRVSVYNKGKNLVANVPILVNGDGTYTVQLAKIKDDEDYYVGVWAAAVDGVVGTGIYHLDIDFRSTVVILDQFASGTLTDTVQTDFQTLETHRDQAMHLMLSATGGAAGQSAVRMTIHDETGAVVFTLTAKAGETLTATTVLTKGTYTIRYQGYAKIPGATLTNLTYTLKGTTLDNPIGPTLADPGKEYAVRKDPVSYYLSLALENPSGDIAW